jgi:hypothetical protein
VREPKDIEINGKKATIAKLDAATAFDVACIVAEWRGKLLAAAGDEALRAESAGIDSVQAAGRMLTQAAKMLRDREYRDLVWTRVLHGCTLDGTSVMAADGKTPREQHDLADLYALHLAAIEHSCGSFLRAVGAGQP